MTHKSLSALNASCPYAIYTPTCVPLEENKNSLNKILINIKDYIFKNNFFPTRKQYHAVTENPVIIPEVKLDIETQLATGEMLRKAGEQVSQQLSATETFQSGRGGRLCNKKALSAAGAFILIGGVCYWLRGEDSFGNMRSANSSALLPPADALLTLEEGPRVAELRSPAARWHNDDGAAMPVPSAESTTMLSPPQRVSEAEFQQGVFEDQTRRLKELLVKAPLGKKLHSGIDRDLLLYIAHYPLRSLVNRVISFINENEENLSRIATLLLDSANEYGGNKDEIISSGQQRATINAWLNQAILGMPLEVWCIKQAQEMKTQHNSLFDHAHLQRRLFNTLNHLSEQGELSAQARTYYQTYVVAPLLPGLHLHLSEEELTTLGKMDITRPEWGYLHAGARLLYDSGASLTDLTLEQIEEAGMLLDNLLREGALPPAWIRYFTLPALFHAVRENAGTQTLTDLSAQEMSDSYRRYFTFASAWLKKNNPFLQFSQAASQWKTRPQLARQQLKNHGVAETWLKIYLDRHRAAEYPGEKGKVTLPDIDKLFKQQNRELADLFRNTDELLLFQIFSTLDADEKEFIVGADVSRVRAEFDASKTLYHIPLPPAARQGMDDASALRYSVPESITLLQCIQNGEERIYALEPKQEKGGYALMRVDRDHEKLLFLLDDVPPPREDSDYKLVISREAQLKKSGETLETLQEVLAAHHREQMLNGLEAQGYQKTLQDKIGDFFLGLVPFYSCVTESLQGNVRGAVPACLADVIGLIPVAGKAAQLRNGVTRALGRATIVALQHGMKQATLSRLLAQSGKRFVEQFPGIAKDVLPDVYGLGLSMVRFADPGVEILMTGGTKGIRTLRRVITTMDEKGPALIRMAKALESKIAARKAQRKKAKQQTAGAGHAPAVRKMAFDPRLHKEVEIAAVGQEKNGQQLWVKVIPGTTALAGKRYYLSAEGVLEPVPLRLNGHLYVITHEGLGGKGGPKAATEGQNLRKRPAPEQEAGPAKKKYFNDIPSQFSRVWVIKDMAIEVRSVGDKTCEALLYLDIETLNLVQAELDASAYEKAVAALTPEQRQALRTWTAFDMNSLGRKYSNGEPEITSGINFELNSALAEGDELSPQQQHIYERMVEALNANILPTQQGDYVRISEYIAGMLNPWATGQIKVGDYVTNGALFMSVSSDTHYPVSIIEDFQGMNKDLSVSEFVIYKFKNARPVPLLADALSLSRFEQEYLYQPGRVFKVTGIAHAEPLITITNKMNPVDYARTGVTLEEVSPEELAAANIVSAKNLFTGKVTPLFPARVKADEPGPSGTQL